MSWIWGFYAKQNFNIKPLPEYHPEPSFQFSNQNYYVAIGGNPNLISFGELFNGRKFFVCGLGISEDAEIIFSAKEWQYQLNKYPDDLDLLNGHFCGAATNGDSLHLFTDALGLREIHILENNNGWYFSSRIDWLFKLADCKIDFKEFGTRWLLINQISDKSIIKNIVRLTSGSSATFTRGKIELKSKNWLPVKSQTLSTDDYKNKLWKLISLTSSKNKKISLSLSGGLDSRVILSFMLNSSSKNWDCHIFQTDSKMDSEIALQILTDLKIPFRRFSMRKQTMDELINSLYEYIGMTYLTESAFTSQKLTYYKMLPQDDMILDGGFGEIWRREFLNKIYYSGKSNIETNNFETIAAHLSYNRANLFNEDCTAVMKEGVIEQLRDIKNKLPALQDVGFGNWLDLFSIKTRLINYYAMEQARVDGYISSYMPFVQVYLLKELLNFPVPVRKNNRLFKSIILSNSPRLAKYNLAKGSMSYPFYFTPLMKRIYSLIHLRRSENELNIFLNTLKEFIMDSVSSTSVKFYSPYNYRVIRNKVEAYYNGGIKYGDFVNWFLTFEIFRQQIISKH